MHRHQRGRPGGLHGDGGPGQSQLVGDPRSEEVRPGAGPDLSVVDPGRPVGPAQSRRVPRGGAARVDADHRSVADRVVRGVLQRVLGALQQDALLRVEDGGLARRDTEEPVVEGVGIHERTGERLRRVGRPARTERIEVRGLPETRRQTDDRDVGVDVTVEAAVAADRCEVRHAVRPSPARRSALLTPAVTPRARSDG